MGSPNGGPQIGGNEPAARLPLEDDAVRTLSEAAQDAVLVQGGEPPLPCPASLARRGCLATGEGRALRAPDRAAVGSWGSRRDLVCTLRWAPAVTPRCASIGRWAPRQDSGSAAAKQQWRPEPLPPHSQRTTRATPWHAWEAGLRKQGRAGLHRPGRGLISKGRDRAVGREGRWGRRPRSRWTELGSREGGAVPPAEAEPNGEAGPCSQGAGPGEGRSRWEHFRGTALPGAGPLGTGWCFPGQAGPSTCNWRCRL